MAELPRKTDSGKDNLSVEAKPELRSPEQIKVMTDIMNSAREQFERENDQKSDAAEYAKSVLKIAEQFNKDRKPFSKDSIIMLKRLGYRHEKLTGIKALKTIVDSLELPTTDTPKTN